MFAENSGYRAMCIQERREVSEAVCSKGTRSSKVGTGGTIGSNVCAGRVIERRISRDTTTPARERGVGDGACIRDRRRKTEQLTDPSKFIGRCPEQVDEFLDQHIEPVLRKEAEHNISKCRTAIKWVQKRAFSTSTAQFNMKLRHVIW